MKDNDIRDKRRYLRSINGIPNVLILAEIFTVILCISYIMKIGGLALDIAASEKHSIADMALLEMNVIFFGTTLFASLGIYSHKPEAWRKVVRSCITFSVAMIISSIYANDSNAHAFDFNPVVTAISLLTLFFMMLFSRRIKEFYTPPMTDIPEFKNWIRFIFYGRLVDSTYEIDFRTKDDGTSASIDNPVVRNDPAER